MRNRFQCHTESVHSEPQHIAVLGLGYVGCVTAACLADRSTVYPGTCEDIVLAALNQSPLGSMNGTPLVSVVSNPEFLREGTAIRDFMEPSLLVVGGADPGAVARVAAIYSPLPVEPA